VVDPSQPVGSHYDQVHRSFFGNFENKGRYIAVSHARLGAYATAIVCLGKLNKLLHGVGAKFSTDFIVIIGESMVRIQWPQRIDDMLQQHKSLVMSRD
jgi:hypothetical protein